MKIVNIILKPLKNLKKNIKKIFINIKLNKRINQSDYLWLSLGENCLSDHILNRHEVKSFSTPYSHGRSNLDYAIQLEKLRYKSFLDIDNLKYDLVRKSKIVRSKIIKDGDIMFDPAHNQGFEFTHHDIIESKIKRDSLKRKVDRLISFKGKKNFIFLYHHRMNQYSNFVKLYDKADQFVKFYNQKNFDCQIVIFSQQIIQDISARKLVHTKVNNHIHHFFFYTNEIWGGDNDDVFWALKDDDLIKEMISIVKANILYKVV